MCSNEERWELQRLKDLVNDGDMPHYPNLPQVDLVSRSYVKLAEAVLNACEKVGL